MPEEISDLTPGCFPNGGWPHMRFHDERVLPVGVWHIVANGRMYNFEITDVSSSGDVSGIFNGEPFDEGRWDNSTLPGRLTFVRVVRTADLRQRFSGYLMSFDTRDYYWRMAGVFGKVEGLEYTEQAGWYATRPRYE